MVVQTTAAGEEVLLEERELPALALDRQVFGNAFVRLVWKLGEAIPRGERVDPRKVHLYAGTVVVLKEGWLKRST